MENEKASAYVAARQRVRQSQRAWKFIRDVNNTSLSDLNKIAIIDGKRKYTYGLMFREWERYASVFSALGMTGSDGSRVGILGSTCAEVIFSFYGLNMTGAEVSVIPAYSAFTPKRIIQTILSEKLTDFIITDDFAQANLIQELLVSRRELGLNNVIVIHVPVAGATVNHMLTAVQEAKYTQLNGIYGPVIMDNLLASYVNCPVSYAPEESNDTAFILHTTGTTSGTGKPVPLSDRAFNAAAACFYKFKSFELPWDNLVTAAIVDLSNSYSMIDQVHVPLAMGAAVVMVPGGILNPGFYKAISEYKISFLFTVSAMFERWLKMKDKTRFDFSSLRFVVLGGAAVSAADKRRFYEFMQKHGAGDVVLLNGYGVSELGGASCISTADIDDEAIGYPLPGVSIRLLDEDSGRYLSKKDAPCEGVLYMHSTSEATLKLDGKEIISTEEIENRPYVCTNDLVRMDADGKITFLGRANRYFINEEGRKYESGRVETEFSRQSGIESCGVVPVFIKTAHDNMPMLVVKTLEAGDDSKDVILKALRQIFMIEKTLKPDHIPARVMIAAELPRNSNGKIDLYKINKGEVEGDIYTVEPVNRLGRLADFRLTPYEDGPADMIKEVIDGISADVKSNLPFNKMTKQSNEEEFKMANTKKALETFNAMNSMGRQMMKNMMSQMTANQASGSFSGMPDMSKMKAGMEQMDQKVKESMDQMNQKAAENMQQLNDKFAGYMPDVQDKVRGQIETALPQMQKQMDHMAECMDQMNKTAIDLMQKMFDQNVKMMDQFFDAAKKQAAPKAEPAKEEAITEKPAKEVKPAKTAAGKRTAKAKEEEK